MKKMVKIELEIKQDKNTIEDFAEKMQIASNTIMVTKQDLLQQLIDKAVVKSKMVDVAGEMFIQFEKKLDESNQKIKSYEKPWFKFKLYN